MSKPPTDQDIALFEGGLRTLLPEDQKLGLAVSGGPDSLALLLLAHAVVPDRIKAVTVDHRLRPEGRTEAELVADYCKQLGVDHDIETIYWPGGAPESNVQAEARKARYRQLISWAAERDIHHIATAHHADDQAETMLMRLARGSGVSGLSGISPSVSLDGAFTIIRPLLTFTKADLVEIVKQKEWDAVEDPSNADDRYDRARLRKALAQAGFADALAYTASAMHLADADDALEWMTDQLAEERLQLDGDEAWIDPVGLPAELRRRLVIRAFAARGDRSPRGPSLAAALARLEDGEQSVLGQTLLRLVDNRWHLSPAPPRKTV